MSCDLVFIVFLAFNYVYIFLPQAPLLLSALEAFSSNTDGKVTPTSDSLEVKIVVWDCLLLSAYYWFIVPVLLVLMPFLNPFQDSEFDFHDADKVVKLDSKKSTSLTPPHSSSGVQLQTIFAADFWWRQLCVVWPWFILIHFICFRLTLPLSHLHFRPKER